METMSITSKDSGNGSSTCYQGNNRDELLEWDMEIRRQ
jgi:hypothetical protein